MRLKAFLPFLLCALLLSACGPKPAMEGASQSSTEEGQVTDSEEASGQGDSTSFSEDVEKVDSYTVVRGDNLWNIAAKREVYGSGWLYPLILKANRGKIKDANRLEKGLILRIPRDISAADREIAREEAMAGTYEGDAPLKSMEEAAPAAAQAASKPAEKKPAPGKKGGKGGSRWLLWLLLAAAAGGAWWYFKVRKAREASAS